MKGKFKKFLPLLLIMIAIAVLFSLKGSLMQNNGPAGLGISLIMPAFAQEAGVSFIEEEAGIAVYTFLDKKIDLAKVKAVLKTVEKETDTYILGSFSISEYKQYGKEDVHCFAHRNGWVVVYYLREEPVAKMVNWQDPGKSKLELGLIEICNFLEQRVPYLQYYHFKYPDATKAMVTVKWQQNSFRIMIPGSFIIHERSWSTSTGSVSMEINGTRISGTSNSEEYGAYGFLSAIQLGLDVFQTIKPYNGNCAIALVYQES